MKLTTCFLALLLLISASVEAAVVSRDWQTPGDGLLTYDTINQREWLDLTETQLFKFPGEALEERYQAVFAETAIGGMFAGFTPAMRDDVFALAESAGIDTTTTHFDTNRDASDNLIQLLGDPIPGAAPPNKWAGGFLDDGILSASLAIALNVGGRAEGAAGVISANFFGSSNGIWLYRQIPEPATGVLIASEVLMFIVTHRKFFGVWS